jgi:hypothetical protein
VKWGFADSGREGSIRACWLLKGIDARTLSARKMMVRANFSVLGEALEPAQEEVSNADQVPEDVQLLRRSYPVRLPMEAGEKTFLIDEEFSLPSSAPMPEKMVSYSFEPQLTEQKVLGGKAVFRGNGNFHMLYQGMDGQLHSHDQEVSFSQFSDLDRDYDKEATLCVIPEVSNVEMEAVEGALQVKAGLVMQYMVYDREQVDVYEDAYSNLRRVDCHKQAVQLPMELDRMQQRLEIGVQVPTVGQIVDVSIYPRHCAVHRALQLHELENCGGVQVVYYDESGRLCADVERYSAIWEIPGECRVIGMLKDTEQPQADQNSVHAFLTLEAIATAEEATPMLAGMELGEIARPDPARPSLILRRAGENGLWQIAKESGSTMEAITKANGLVGEPPADQMLLIPVV